MPGALSLLLERWEWWDTWTAHQDHCLAQWARGSECKCTRCAAFSGSLIAANGIRSNDQDLGPLTLQLGSQISPHDPPPLDLFQSDTGFSQVWAVPPPAPQTPSGYDGIVYEPYPSSSAAWSPVGSTPSTSTCVDDWGQAFGTLQVAQSNTGSLGSCERGAAVAAEPGADPPGVADTGVAPRLPPFKLPSAVQSATVPGCLAKQKNLNEFGAGTNLVPARRPRRRFSCKKATEFVCEECTALQGRVVFFNCKKDLKRHKLSTKAHNARIVAYCECGKGATRIDGLKVHRKRCRLR
ncbi:hypothetical protein BC826DRAFT_1173205 [Russula brevipes]|nr:hypothetical protein BC826DRAFT_1173205 [Russula brevipes]